MVTMVCGGFFLSFCFGRMANIVGRLDAEKSARSEKVGAGALSIHLLIHCLNSLLPVYFLQLDQVTLFLKDVDLPKPLARKYVSSPGWRDTPRSP